MRKTPRYLILSSIMVFLVGGAMVLPALVATSVATGQEIANESVYPDGISFQPLVQYERFVMTISGPGGMVLQQEFEAGNPPVFAPFDDSGKALPDGQYNYEIHVSPVLDPETKKMMAASRESGDDAARAADLRARGWIPEHPVVQSGSFSIVNGAIVDPNLPEP